MAILTDPTTETPDYQMLWVDPAARNQWYQQKVDSEGAVETSPPETPPEPIPTATDQEAQSQPAPIPNAPVVEAPKTEPLAEPKPPEPPKPPAPTDEHSQFLQSHSAAAQKYSQQTGIPPEVFLAIGASETNWGRAGGLFGIKGKGPKGGSANYDTWEMVDGKRVNTKADFATYSNDDEAFQHLLGPEVLGGSRYQPAMNYLKETGDVAGWLKKVNEAGYATDPNWSALIMSMAKDIGGQDLNKLGGSSPAHPYPESPQFAQAQRVAQMVLPINPPTVPQGLHPPVDFPSLAVNPTKLQDWYKQQIDADSAEADSQRRKTLESAAGDLLHTGPLHAVEEALSADIPYSDKAQEAVKTSMNVAFPNANVLQGIVSQAGGPDLPTAGDLAATAVPQTGLEAAVALAGASPTWPKALQAIRVIPGIGPILEGFIAGLPVATIANRPIQSTLEAIPGYGQLPEWAKSIVQLAPFTAFGKASLVTKLLQTIGAGLGGYGGAKVDEKLGLPQIPLVGGPAALGGMLIGGLGGSVAEHPIKAAMEQVVRLGSPESKFGEASYGSGPSAGDNLEKQVKDAAARAAQAKPEIVRGADGRNTITAEDGSRIEWRNTPDGAHILQTTAITEGQGMGTSLRQQAIEDIRDRNPNAKITSEVTTEAGVRLAARTGATFTDMSGKPISTKEAIALAKEGKRPPVSVLDLGKVASPDLVDAKASLINLIKEEEAIRKSGAAAREISEGRAAQAEGIRRAASYAKEQGLSAEEQAKAARQAQTVGPLRQTLPKPIELPETQKTSLFEEILRQHGSGEIRDFEMTNAAVALTKALSADPRGLQPGEVILLRRIFGDEVATALVSHNKKTGPAQGLTGEKLEFPSDKDARSPGMDIPTPEQAAERARLSSEWKDFNDSNMSQAEYDAIRAKQQGDLPSRSDMRYPPHWTQEDIHRYQNMVAGLQQTGFRGTGEAINAELGLFPGPLFEATPVPNVEKPTSGADLKTQRLNRALLDKTGAAEYDPATAPASFQGWFGDVDSLPLNYDTLYKAADILARSTGSPNAAEIVKYQIEVQRQISLHLDTQTGLDRLAQNVRSVFTRDLPDSYLTALVKQGEHLDTALQMDGIDPKMSRKIVRTLREAAIRERYKTEVPQQVRDDLVKLNAATYNESWGGLELFVQRWKNVKFSTDVGVVGIQLKAAVDRGSVSGIAGYVNRTLAMLSLPHAELYGAEVNLPKDIRNALDGVYTGHTNAGVESGQGTLATPILKKGGKIGTGIDSGIERVMDISAKAQFGVVLGHVRNVGYEGNLFILKLLGRDINNPLVRATAADYANATTSWAHGAMTKSKGLEKVLLSSPPMLRSEIANTLQMLKFFNPSATAEQRILAGVLITSRAASILLVGKALNDQFGVGDFEMNPFAAGFGLLTTPWKDGKGRNVILSLFPQESMVKAIGKAALALMDGSPEDAGNAMLRALSGRSSLIGQTIANATGYGYDAAGRFHKGDLSNSPKALLENALSPPIASQFMQDPDAIYLGAQAVGQSAFPDSTQRATHDEAMHALASDPSLAATAQRLGFTLTPTAEAQLKKNLALDYTKLGAGESKLVDAWMADKYPELRQVFEDDRRKMGSIYQRVADKAEDIKQTYAPIYKAQWDDLSKGVDPKVVMEAWKKSRDEERGAIQRVYGDPRPSVPQDELAIKYKEAVAKLEPSDIRQEEAKYRLIISQATSASNIIDWDKADVLETKFLSDLYKSNPEMLDRLVYNLSLESQASKAKQPTITKFKQDLDTSLKPYYAIKDDKSLDAAGKTLLQQTWLSVHPTEDALRWLLESDPVHSTKAALSALDLGIARGKDKDGKDMGIRVAGSDMVLTKANAPFFQTNQSQIDQLIQDKGKTQLAGRREPTSNVTLLRSQNPLYDALFYVLGLSNTEKTGQYKGTVSVYYDPTSYLKQWGVQRVDGATPRVVKPNY